MSWLFSQALVEAFLGASSLDGEPCAPLSVMPTQHRFWRNDKTMEPSNLSRFGLTCAVLTEDRGAALLTSFLEVSRARTSALLGEEQESKAPARASGLNLLGSLARFDPASSSWKTPQCSLVEGLDEFSETWPRWGSMRNGACWARQTPEPLTAESASGFLPTPTATSYGTNQGGAAGRVGKVRPSLRTMAARDMWPTPQAHDCHPGNPARVGRFGTKHGGRNLNDEVAMWPTPRASDGEKGGPNQRGRKGDLMLSSAVHRFATPQSRDHRTGQPARFENPDRTKNLNDQIGGQLNPPWVEWLMGWPIGWTDLKPLETAKFQQWLRSHLKRCAAA